LLIRTGGYKMNANRRINRRGETVETLLLTVFVILMVATGAYLCARSLDKPQRVTKEMNR
jgi:hypothetical protein